MKHQFDLYGWLIVEGYPERTTEIEPPTTTGAPLLVSRGQTSQAASG